MWLNICFNGLAPITHLHTYVIKIDTFKGGHPNVVKVIFHAIRNCSKRKEFGSSGGKFFPLREVSILSPFDVHNRFSILATPLCFVKLYSVFSR